MPAISLREISRENWRDALTLTVRPDQQRFVADYTPIVLIGLAKAYVGSLGLTWLPYAIYADEMMIGFVELAYKPDTHDQYWMYHFFIDERKQGKGLGKLALQAFIEQVKIQFPNCQCINLTVHPENVSAQHLYLRAGFIPTGENFQGEPLYRLAFRK